MPPSPQNAEHPLGLGLIREEVLPVIDRPASQIRLKRLACEREVWLFPNASVMIPLHTWLMERLLVGGGTWASRVPGWCGVVFDAFDG